MDLSRTLLIGTVADAQSQAGHRGNWQEIVRFVYLCLGRGLLS
jgi:hypothetical protein